jgi:hypothetical protein
LVQSCDHVARELAAALENWREAHDVEALRAALASVSALLDSPVSADTD